MNKTKSNRNISLIMALMVSIVMLIAACSTPYQPKGTLGGYSQEKILANMYKVEFVGNQHSKPEVIQNFLMYRCAELTLEQGFEYFSIVSEERHYDKYSVRPEREVSFETRTSASGGTRTIVKPDLQTASSSTKYTGVYFIKFITNIDEQYKNTIFYAPDVLAELSEIVKK